MKILRLIPVVLMMSSNAAWAHARLKVPVPRSTSSGLKTGPCGGIPRGTTARIFAPGQTIQVNWEETINHPGYFTIEFSPADDQNFAILKSITDTQNDQSLHQFTTTVNLPTATCDACTLRLIQYMTEDPANPSLYYSCADIKIQVGGDPGGGTSGGGNTGQSGTGIPADKPFGQMSGGCSLAKAESPAAPPLTALWVLVLPTIVGITLRRRG